MKLLVATSNTHKIEEFKRILQPLGVEILSPQELKLAVDVEETGTTFLENARIKAQAIYALTGVPCVADDSGLCVDALDGRPGVYSARYLGDVPQSQKNAGLLKELATVPDAQRTARFVAAICCVIDEKTELSCQGVCEGRIAHQPGGEAGFGYDPIFLVGQRSFAELSGEEKDCVSHRGIALRELAAKLESYLAN